MIFFKKIKLTYLATFFFEVIVIFVGITISFYFDEWREEKSRNTLENEYLNRLAIDIDKDILFCEYAIKNSEEFIENYEIALDALSGNKFADSIFSYLMVSQISELNNFTFVEMQNNGVFYSIKNTEIKSKILNYYKLSNEFLKILEIVKKLNLDLKEELNPYIKYNNPGNTFLKMEIIKEINGNIILNNIIAELMTYSNFQIALANYLIDQGKELKKEIGTLISNK